MIIKPEPVPRNDTPGSHPLAGRSKSGQFPSGRSEPHREAQLSAPAPRNLQPDRTPATYRRSPGARGGARRCLVGAEADVGRRARGGCPHFRASDGERGGANGAGVGRIREVSAGDGVVPGGRVQAAVNWGSRRRCTRRRWISSSVNMASMAQLRNGGSETPLESTGPSHSLTMFTSRP
jgi:hypothetical protein